MTFSGGALEGVCVCVCVYRLEVLSPDAANIIRLSLQIASVMLSGT